MKLDPAEGAAFLPLGESLPLIIPRSFMFCYAVPEGGRHADSLLCKVKQERNGTVRTKITNTDKKIQIHNEKSGTENELDTGKLPHSK